MDVHVERTNGNISSAGLDGIRGGVFNVANAVMYAVGLEVVERRDTLSV
jgi:hypothetical protein